MTTSSELASAMPWLPSVSAADGGESQPEDAADYRDTGGAPDTVAPWVPGAGSRAPASPVGVIPTQQERTHTPATNPAPAFTCPTPFTRPAPTRDTPAPAATPVEPGPDEAGIPAAWQSNEAAAAPTATPTLAALDMADVLALQRQHRPKCGWRGVVYAATDGRWNPGLSEAEATSRTLTDRIRTPLPGTHTVAVSSLKGGSGKTTIAAGIGLTLAEYRGDRIIALDANPDAGTLAERLTGHCGMTVRELISNLDSVRSWTDMAHYTSLAGRLQVLASEQDPAMSEAFTRAEYQAVWAVLAGFFNVIITDTGTGLVHSAMGGALAATDTLVLAAAPTVDGTSRAAKTLDWLVAHGHQGLVERAVVALSCDRASREIDSDRIVGYFRDRCHTVVTIPADPHLALGGVIELDALRRTTRDAFARLAAAVADQFSGARSTTRVGGGW